MQHDTEFLWTTKRKNAVPMLARGDTIDEVARALRVDRATIWRWNQHDAFRAAVQASNESIREALKAEGVANRQNRMDAYNDRWQRLQQVLDARAVSPTPREENSERAYGDANADAPPVERIPVPGWETGMLVKVVRVAGKSVEIRYEVDTGLLKELREHEKQAAQDSGQWTEKRDIGLPPGAASFTLKIDHAGSDDTEDS